MPKFNCVICKESSKGHGNNAQPLANGKCCDDCNKTVLCYRMMYAFQVFTCPKCRKGYTPKYKSLLGGGKEQQWHPDGERTAYVTHVQ
jgi:hypothetical protein